MVEKSDYLTWIDLEMTGLDPEADHIVEIATLVTDHDLNIIALGPEIAIYQPEEVLGNMNDWCQQHHTASGLIRRVRESKITVTQAEQMTLTFLKQYTQRGPQPPMCGNSVHQDRRFLYRYMLELADFFHYRHLDVSALKVINQYWELTPRFEKKNTHRALDDIHESIAELRYYRQYLLRSV